MSARVHGGAGTGRLDEVGLAGKVPGPIGLAMLIFRGEWPPRSAVLCLTNDIIWWIPFALYLRDAWPFFRRSLREDPLMRA